MAAAVSPAESRQDLGLGPHPDPRARAPGQSHELSMNGTLFQLWLCILWLLDKNDRRRCVESRAGAHSWAAQTQPLPQKRPETNSTHSGPSWGMEKQLDSFQGNLHFGGEGAAWPRQSCRSQSIPGVFIKVTTSASPEQFKRRGEQQ